MSFNQYFNLYKQKHNLKDGEAYQEVHDDKQIVINLVSQIYTKYAKDGKLTETALEKIMKEVGLGEFNSNPGITMI